MLVRAISRGPSMTFSWWDNRIRINSWLRTQGPWMDSGGGSPGSPVVAGTLPWLHSPVSVLWGVLWLQHPPSLPRIYRSVHTLCRSSWVCWLLTMACSGAGGLVQAGQSLNPAATPVPDPLLPSNPTTTEDFYRRLPRSCWGAPTDLGLQVPCSCCHPVWRPHWIQAKMAACLVSTICS